MSFLTIGENCARLKPEFFAGPWNNLRRMIVSPHQGRLQSSRVVKPEFFTSCDGPVGRNSHE